MKRRISLVAAAFALCALAGPALATWSPTTTVKSIRQSRSSYDSGKTVIELNGAACSAGNFYISDTSTNKEHQIKMLLAALLSGKRVSLGYSVVTGAGCEVYSVIIAE